MLNFIFLLLSNHLSISLVGLFFFLIDWETSKENTSIYFLYFKSHRIKYRSWNEVYNIYSTSYPIVIRSLIVMSINLFILDYMVNWEKLESMTNLNILLNFFLMLSSSLLLLGGVHHILHMYAYIIHKTHHRYHHPVSITTYYHSLTETILNFSIFYSIVYFFVLPFKWMCLSLIFGNILAMVDHSGYKIFGAIYHNYHHTEIKVNYSTFPFIDRIMKTYHN
jgi:sterol desaturase/sphingolipid hydroxylase (fatty acid hydroxylase superfamily)